MPLALALAMVELSENLGLLAADGDDDDDEERRGRRREGEVGSTVAGCMNVDWHGATRRKIVDRWRSGTGIVARQTR